jgi:DNA-binding response OmpR family regulator
MRHRRANDVRIAIIDGNPGAVDLISSTLSASNIQVMSATDPEEGLDLVFRLHPHIVITDLVLRR